MAEKRTYSVPETCALLVAKYPQLFNYSRPLKIGIRQDIRLAMPELGHKKLQRALRIYTMHLAYQELLIVEGANRFGLDGKAAGTVSDKEAAAAIRRLKQPRQQTRRAA